MSLVDRYRMYREANRKLNVKVMKACLERDAFMSAANLLSIAEGNAVFFDSMDETDVIMDFALNDYKVDGKNAVQIYRERYGGNELELDILDALLSSYTSLFKITSVSRREKLVFFNDIINKRCHIGLMDIALSRTATVGMLLFFRLLSFSDFNMASGVSFAFPGELESYLLRKYKKLRKKVESDSEAIKRFVSFFWLSKTDGLEMKYEEIL
ncbi:MAG: hypothetical protein JRG73_20980 [Deltaproteobacteria bacterium]|nr:hypothetical protein [Deltaproteobacteria bacterium]